MSKALIVKSAGSASRRGVGPTFGYGGHSERHGDLEVVDGASQPAATVHGVAEVAHVDGPHRHADHADHLHGRNSRGRQSPPGTCEQRQRQQQQ